MNYIWSKHSLLEFIYQWISEIVDHPDYIVSDLFAGTGAVGKMFKSKWHRITANDLQYYSYILNANYIGNHQILYFMGLITIAPWLIDVAVHDRKSRVCDYLTHIEWVEWFIYHNYSPWGTKDQEHERMYFSDYNAKQCDAIRMKIEQRYTDESITESEYHFLLATLIEAIDKVANTASVYGAFLKKFKQSALKPLVMKPAEYYIDNHDHQVYNLNINDLIKTTTHDVVYLNPPYNQRQYSGNYHILETIALYDDPIIKGKTGLRDRSNQKSGYSSRSQVLKDFTDLIDTIDAKYVFLSYNDEGLMSHDEIKQIMSNRWEYGVYTTDYARFKADKTENRNHKKDRVTEYLHRVKIQQ